MASMATNNEQAAPTDAQDQGGADAQQHGGAAPEPAGEEVESNWTEVTATFDDMDLKEDLLRGIYAHGFEDPSAIQQQAIVPVINGHDGRFFSFNTKTVGVSDYNFFFPFSCINKRSHYRSSFPFFVFCSHRTSPVRHW
jgi:hypothetical protein